MKQYLKDYALAALICVTFVSAGFYAGYNFPKNATWADCVTNSSGFVRIPAGHTHCVNSVAKPEDLCVGPPGYCQSKIKESKPNVADSKLKPDAVIEFGAGSVLKRRVEEKAAKKAASPSFDTSETLNLSEKPIYEVHFSFDSITFESLTDKEKNVINAVLRKAMHDAEAAVWSERNIISFEDLTDEKKLEFQKDIAKLLKDRGVGQNSGVARGKRSK